MEETEETQACFIYLLSIWKTAFNILVVHQDKTGSPLSDDGKYALQILKKLIN